MHIQKLEIHGFKSFPDRVSFHFGPGISGVVGPNGCGKSNVVDAVKWCLGEQSARSLRGSQMVDIIFAGTQERPATGVAEVSLTFAADGEPFPGEYARHAELQITRRIFRDGKGEYRINGARCRLRDVQDIFLDTGANNRLYSFIEQGRIGQIISARPEERRHLIEEAAGISRFKARRDEAEQRLTETSQNLEEATRTLDELTARMRTLERQVRKAIRHRRLKGRIRQAEILLGLARFSGLVGDRKVLAEQLRQAEHDEAEAIRAVTQREAAIALARTALQAAEERVSTRRDELAEVEASRRESESARLFQAREAEELRRRLVGLAADAERAGEQAVAARARCDEARREGDRVDALLQGLEAQLQQARARLETVESTLRARRQRIEQAKDVVLQAVKRVARERGELESAKQRKADLDRRAAQVHSRKGEVGSSIQQLEAAVLQARQSEASSQERAVACREALAAAREAEGQARGHRDAAHRDVVEASKALDLSNRAVAEAERSLASASARLDSLIALQAAHDGVDDAARRVIDAGGTLGALAEHLDVPQELEAALALALGPALDAILVPDASQGARSIAAAGEGRLALLPLQPATAGSGALLARVDGSEHGRAALARLLDGCELAASPAEAMEAWRPGQPVLSLSAPPCFIDGRGLVSQGKSSAVGTVLLARRRQIAAQRLTLDELRAQVDKAVAARDLTTEGLDQARKAEARVAGAHEEARRRVDAAQGGASEAEVAVRMGQRERQDAERARDAEIVREERLQRDLAELGAQATALGGTIAALQARVAEGEATQAAAEAGLQGDQVGLPGDEQAVEAAREARANLAAEAAGSRERLAALRREGGAAEVAAGESQARQEAAVAAIEAARARLGELVEEDGRLDGAIAELLSRQAVVEAQLGVEREDVRGRRSAIEKDEAELRKARERQTQSTAHRAGVDRQLAQVKTDITNIREGLEERHEVSAAGLLDRLDRNGHIMLAGEDGGAGAEGAGGPEGGEAGEERCEELRVTRELLEDEPAIEGWVQALKSDRQALDRLGEVNLIAQQEYTEVAARHAELEQQRQDLEESVRAIRQVIGGLNKTCRERFRDTFDRVDAGFREIYPRLVGGGMAKLLLTNEEDLLETGVDIIVQPPGKKLQQLSLLSGGEMAMTAIALIFALFRVKPSPFCLLDEVDAPLDEGNGARFNQTLREMSKLSQFIVITHNKKTMECADTLYGVTMVVPGVSRLVSVQLD